MKQTVTISGTCKGYNVTITQDQHLEFGGGHYRYVIFEGENIVAANTTMGGAPSENISQKTIEQLVGNYIYYLEN